MQSTSPLARLSLVLPLLAASAVRIGAAQEAAPPQAPKGVERAIEGADGLLVEPALEPGRASVLLLARAGSLYEPAEQAGLVAVLAAALRAEPGLDAWLAEHDASLSVEHDPDYLVLALECPEEHLAAGLARAAALLAEPRLPAAAVDAARSAARAALPAESAATLADRTLAMVSYGARSPFATLASAETLARVDRDALAGHLRAFAGRDRVFAGVAAAAGADDVAATLATALESLEKSTSDADARHPTFRTPIRTQIYVVDRPDRPADDETIAGAKHTELRIATAGASLGALRYPPWLVWSELVGATVAQRFAHLPSVRVRHAGAAYERAGQLEVAATVPHDEVGRTATDLLEYVASSLERAQDEEALEAAKAAASGRAGHAGSTPRAAFRDRVRCVAAGLPPAFWNDRERAIRNMTPEIVVMGTGGEVALQQFVVVAVGPGAKLERSLGYVAAVQVLPPTLEAARTPEGIAAAARLVEALGGAERWSDVRALHIAVTASTRLVDPNGQPYDDVSKHLQWRSLDDMLFREERRAVGRGLLVDVLDGAGGWSRDPVNVTGVAPRRLAMQQGGARRYLYRLVHRLAAGEPLGLSVDESGALLVFDDLEPLARLVLEKSGRPRSLSWAGLGYEQTFVYDEWAEHEGIRYARAWHLDGIDARFEITRIELNPELTDELFARP